MPVEPAILPQHVDEVEDEGQDIMTQPFDPAKIRVETKQMSIDTLISRMKNNEIKLQPEFQRKEVWKAVARSRLIESILIRIPLPAFYMDATDEDLWLVVDGQQRLSTIRDFAIEKTMHLKGLEFLGDLEGKNFDELPRQFQRRINETNVTVYLIEKGTPGGVKINIFKRINTGGMPLSAQEIRHALYSGPVTTMLRELAESPEFLEATGGRISSDRMGDREHILRFFSFVLTPPSAYAAQEFDAFLGDAMSQINGLNQGDRQTLSDRFSKAMVRSFKILEGYAFRKKYSADEDERLKPVNKALFEAWAVNLDALDESDARKLIKRKSVVLESFVKLMNVRDFDQAISQGTGSVQNVRYRFEAIQKLIREVLR